MSDLATQSREPFAAFHAVASGTRDFVGLWCRSAPFAPGTAFGTLLGLFAARWLQTLLGDTLFLPPCSARCLSAPGRPVLPGAHWAKVTMAPSSGTR